MRGRDAIKAALPRLYDYHWQECDAGSFFNVPFPAPRMKKFQPRDQLIRSGSYGIRFAYRDCIEIPAMALAAERVALETADALLANYMRFVIRNRHATNAARAYFRFLDQVVFHMYEVSDRTLMAHVQPKYVTFGRLQQAIRDKKLAGPARLVRTAKRVRRMAASGLTDAGWALLERFRNADTHRYPVGIDHISVRFGRTDGETRVLPGGRTIIFGDPDGKAWAFYGAPEVDFGTVSELLRAGMINSKAILAELAAARLLLADV